MATPPRPSTLADNSPQWASGCPTCMAIWLQFSGPESAPDINLGSYEEALSTACPRHKELIQEFVHCIHSEEPNNQSFDRSDFGFRKPRQGFSISISQSVSGSGHLWNLLLVKKDDVPEHPGNGRSTRPAWLVDVQKQCVVPGHEPVDYVAISYTYGSHTPPVITSTAFKGLQKPFALETPEFSDFASPIIRHAMYLTSAVDERCLWADALCVTHHDPKAASEQLRSMGSIYVNAVAIIIATDGDSRSGVPGLKGMSNPQGLSQNVIAFGDERLILRNTSFLDEMIFFPTQRQSYYQRGRTCQEYALAKRKIIFNNLEIHWIDNELHLQSNIVMDGFPDETHLFAAILTNTTSGRCPLRKMPSLLSPVYYQSSVEPSNVDFCMGFQRCSSSIVSAGEHLGRKVCNAAPRQADLSKVVSNLPTFLRGRG
ncbi:Heterokaryon incompatibility [Fusarium oxysporum f. sp. vasinfectum]|nr:Heterokaryon incompatibility [Fusarium oxysporum f. sp. vasinfectum]